MATAVLVAGVLIVVIVAGGLSFYVFSSVGSPSSQRSTTSSSQSTSSLSVIDSSASTTSSSSSHSTSASPTSSSTSSSSSSSSSSTVQSSTSSACSASSSSSTFVLPSCGSEVIIPPGIQDSNAKALNITFDPFNLKVVIGVNNTVYFVNNDLQDNLGHVLETNSWPSSGQPFAFEILPGQVMNVTLSTPGKYLYNCEWHPVWMTGTITVVAG
jgi:plastocyanin